MTWLDRLSTAFALGRRFRAHLTPHRWTLALVAGIFLLGAALEVLRPWPMQWIFDGALSPREAFVRPPLFYLWTGAAAALAIVVVHALLQYVGAVRTAEVGQSVIRSLRTALFAHLCQLSPLFHAKHKTGDMIVRLLGDAQMVKTMLVESSVALAARVVVVLGIVGVMMVVDRLLAVVVLGLVPVLFVLVRVSSRKITSIVRKQRNREGALADFLQETLAASTVIQSLGSADYTVRRFKQGNRRTTRAGVRAAKAAARLSALVESTLGLSFATTLLFGSLRVLDGHLSPGQLLVFLAYVRSIAKPIRSASKQMTKVAKGTACAERILNVLDTPDELRASAGDRIVPSEPGLLAFHDVNFGYDEHTQAVKGVNLELRRGELTALFGPSGAGKSTLTALALRLMDPQRGVVRLAGVDLRHYDLDSLRGAFALSMQESTLLGETIRENLLLGKPDASDEELLRALREADAWDFVHATGRGLDAELGSAGSGLSGGQSRRICLARALLRDAPILILDEPFNGLDRRAADTVSATLRAKARDHIVLVITHDVERLAGFDRVVFLEEGRVRACGEHEELKRSQPRYLEICATRGEEVA